MLTLGMSERENPRVGIRYQGQIMKGEYVWFLEIKKTKNCGKVSPTGGGIEFGRGRGECGVF